MKVTNDFITTQQGEHRYYMQRPQSPIEEIVEEAVNIIETIQQEDVPTSTNLIQEVM